MKEGTKKVAGKLTKKQKEKLIKIDTQGKEFTDVLNGFLKVKNEDLKAVKKKGDE